VINYLEGKFILRRKLLIGLVVVGLVTSIFICDHTYSAPSIDGVVLDSESNKPLSNVVLVAVWYSQSPGFHSSRDKFFETQEVKTDKDGKFSIPGWRVRFLTRFFGGFSTDQPQIIVYKYGYIPEKLQNFSRESREHPFTIEWHQETIIKLDPSVGALSDQLNTLEDRLFLARISFNCTWSKNKYLLAELDKFYEEQEAYTALLSGRSQNPWLQEANPIDQEGCESLSGYLKSERSLRGGTEKVKWDSLKRK